MPGDPLRVGLVGAGPWAGLMHAPMLAAGPETTLVGVWARRETAASELADKHGVRAFASYEELLDAVEAVAFAVAPSVQPELALQAVRKGKSVLLEKPIALDAAEAERLVDAIDEAGVGSLLALTFRLCPAIADFVDAAAVTELIGGRATFLSGGYVSGPFTTPWRLDGGTLLDLGPHVLDLLVASLGPIVDIRARRGAKEWWGLVCEHEDGAVSDVVLCSYLPVTQRFEVELFGPAGRMFIEGTQAMGERYQWVQQGAWDRLPDVPAFGAMRREFARAARDGTHQLDARHGLELQRLIDMAAAAA